MSDSPTDRFANERSHTDAESAAEYGKALLQLLVGANGIAATAMLTLAGAMKNNLLTAHLAPALVLYLSGVSLGILFGILLWYSSNTYASSWQHRYYGSVDKSNERSRRARRKIKQAQIAAWVSLLLFLAGGLYSGYVIYNFS